MDDEELPVEDLAVVQDASGAIGLPEESSVPRVAEPLEQEHEALLRDVEVGAEAHSVGARECPDHPALGGELLLLGREQIAAVSLVERLRPPRQAAGAELVDQSARLLA
jgi:hypothetical protein